MRRRAAELRPRARQRRRRGAAAAAGARGGARARDRASACAPSAPPPYVGVTWRAGLLRGGAAALSRRADLDQARAGRGARRGCCGRSQATIVILQRRPDPQDLAQFRAALGRDALDAADMNDDLRDALALLSLLDEYIGVSNTNMHLLAGLAASARACCCRIRRNGAGARRRPRASGSLASSSIVQRNRSSWNEALRKARQGSDKLLRRTTKLYGRFVLHRSTRIRACCGVTTRCALLVQQAPRPVGRGHPPLAHSRGLLEERGWPGTRVCESARGRVQLVRQRRGYAEETIGNGSGDRPGRPGCGVRAVGGAGLRYRPHVLQHDEVR